MSPTVRLAWIQVPPQSAGTYPASPRGHHQHVLGVFEEMSNLTVPYELIIASSNLLASASEETDTPRQPSYELLIDNHPLELVEGRATLAIRPAARNRVSQRSRVLGVRYADPSNAGAKKINDTLVITVRAQ